MAALALALCRWPQGFYCGGSSCGCSGIGFGSLASEVFIVGVGLEDVAALSLALGRWPQRLFVLWGAGL